MKRQRLMVTVGAGFMMAVGALLVGCGGGSGSGNPPPPGAGVPAISNINNATSPSVTVNVPNVPNPSIQINGSNFQSAPGQVVFTQGSLSATVVPSPANWTNAGIVAVVPSGSSTAQFTMPGQHLSVRFCPPQEHRAYYCWEDRPLHPIRLPFQVH